MSYSSIAEIIIGHGHMFTISSVYGCSCAEESYEGLGHFLPRPILHREVVTSALDGDIFSLWNVFLDLLHLSVGNKTIVRALVFKVQHN